MRRFSVQVRGGPPTKGEKVIVEGKTKTITRLTEQEAAKNWNASEAPYKHLVNIKTKNRLTANDAAIDATAIVAAEKTNQTCDVFRYLEKQEIDRGSERERFINGFRSIALNECFLISCLFLMAIMSIGKLNNFGLTTFLILYVARVSAKLNLFFGVPYINLHFLTAPLKHIATFCRVAPIGFFFIASTIMLGLMFLFLVGFVIYSESMSELQFGYLLLSTLAGLAVLEHLFMALPIKDATLWNWLLPNFRKSSEAIKVVETKPNFPKESKNEL